jgi:hypothetical protein
MKCAPQARVLGCSGYTVTELLIASALSLLVLAITLSVFSGTSRSWRGIELRMQADHDVNMAMSRMVYGVGDRLGLRSAAGVTLTTNSTGWTMSYRTGGMVPQTNSFTYSTSTKNLVFNPGLQIVGRDLSLARAIAGSGSLVVTLRVDRVAGMLNVRREIGTEISFRNN